MQPTPEAHAALPSPLARATIARIDEAMHSGEAHCLPELVQIIHSLSAKATSISVEDLADRIERHVAVMARVIAAANTFGYNPGRAEIATLRQAIQVIGFERIRSLVTSLLLVRHAVDSETAQEQRGAALGAVISGLMCQTIAADRGIVDPELAFIAASLRQLGRLLLATYLPEDYRQAIAQPGNEGFIAVFGLTPLALTREILGKAHFPRKLLDCMHEPGDAPAPQAGGETAALQGLSEFSEQLSMLVLASAAEREHFAQQVAELGRRHGERLSFTPEQLGSLMGFVGDRLEEFTGKLGFKGVSSEAVSALRYRSNRPNATAPALPKPKAEQPKRITTDKGAPVGDPSTQAPRTNPPLPPAAAKPPGPMLGTPPPDSAMPPEAAPAPTEASPEQPAQPAIPATAADIQIRHWRDGLVSLTASLGENTIQMGSLYSLALDFVRRGFGAQEALLLSLDKDGKHYSATCGVGQVFERVDGSRCMQRDERTVLGVCIARRENVLIHNTGDPRTDAYLPAWCRMANGWGAFVSIPLHDQTHCFALMLVAWPKPMQIGLSPEHIRLLRSITSTISAARRLSNS